MLSLYCLAVLTHFNYLAVLIANKLTAKPQVGVDYRGQNMVKFVQDEKYST